MSKLRSAYRHASNPPAYVVASMVVAVGGLLNGLDTGTIGPVTDMAQFTTTIGPLSPTLHGLVVSSILLSAAVMSIFAGPCSDILGRTKAIGYGSVGFAVGAAIEAGATSLPMLLVGRLIVGAGEGLFLSSLVVYICEIVPPASRGPLASLVQGFITVGLCAGYFIAYGTVRLTSSFAWRIPIIIQLVIAVALAVASFCYLPESPRWLSHCGRRAEATAIWEKLQVSSAEREKESLEADRQTREMGWRQHIESVRVVFRKGARKQLLLGVFLMSFQQLSGIDGVLYYAPLLFSQAGISSAKATFLASGVSAILIMVATVPGFLLSDKIGRRASTIYGGIVLFGCMALIGSLYASDSVSPTEGAARWVVIVSIYVYSIAYCVTWALGIKIFVSEIQPVETRAGSTSVSQSANCIMNFFVAFITPVLLAQSSYGAYFLFAGAILLTILVCVVFMPETRGVDLEQIQTTMRDHKAKDVELLRLTRRVASTVLHPRSDSGHSSSASLTPDYAPSPFGSLSQ